MSPSPNRTYTFRCIRLSILEFLRSVRELSGMEFVMTLIAEDQCFPLSSYHDLFPSFLSIHVFELFDVMDLEESPFFSTEFADVCFESLL